MSRIELDDYDEDRPFLDLDDDDYALDHPSPSTDTTLTSSSNANITTTAGRKPSISSPSSSPSSTIRIPSRSWQASSPSSIVLLVASVKFLMVTSGMLMLMPVYRLIEDAFCHVHYNDDSEGLIDEMKCKVDEVQAPLAYLMGWLGLLGAVVNLIVTYPYGMLADRVGRKPTVLLAYGGLAFSFCLSPFMLGSFKVIVRQNPYILMTGSVFTLVGGGVHVLMHTMYAIVSDVSTEENKSTHFLYLSIGVSAGALLGPLTAGLLMENFGPWVPISLVLFTVPAIFIMLAFIPETLSIHVKPEDPAYRAAQPGHNESTLTAMREHIASGLRDMRRSLQMLRNRNILLCLIVFFFQSARGTAASATVTQYMSKNYGWTIAKISILLAPLGIIDLIVLASLPKLSAVLVSPRFGLTTFRKDLLLAQVSLLILALSGLIRAFSSGVGLFIFGIIVSSFSAADNTQVRVTITYFANPSHTSRLYALAGMAEIVGAFAGPPVLAWLFDMGMRFKGLWTGLPWFYLTGVCLVCWAVLLMVRPPRKDWDESNVFGGSEEDGDVEPSRPIHLD